MPHVPFEGAAFHFAHKAARDAAAAAAATPPPPAPAEAPGGAAPAGGAVGSLRTWLFTKHADTSRRSRWEIVPAAVLVHLCIGSVYAWSVVSAGLRRENADWPRGYLTPETSTFSVAIVFLGLSAAVAGRWVDLYGPRVTSMSAGLFFGTGSIAAGLGASLHSWPLVVLGYGVCGGIGLGVAYVSPVSTLVKWFPDRRGMATGFAVMGFGGGAAVAAQVQQALIESSGVATCLYVTGCVYLVVMLGVGATLQIPPPHWSPAGFDAHAHASSGKHGHLVHVKIIRSPTLTLAEALRTRAFWLMWCTLFINVSAGIGVLSVAKVLIRDTFHRGDAEATNIVTFISFANMGGRFAWAFLSDYVGRRATFALFAAVQALMFGFMPTLVAAQAWAPFLVCVFTIYTMYGGGFACIPAFLADTFGAKNVASVHGAILTAWATAGIVGPSLLMTTLQEVSLRAGRTGSAQYDLGFYVTCGMLCVMAGVVALTSPLKEGHHHDGEARDAAHAAHPAAAGAAAAPASPSSSSGAAAARKEDLAAAPPAALALVVVPTKAPAGAAAGAAGVVSDAA